MINDRSRCAIPQPAPGLFPVFLLALLIGAALLAPRAFAQSADLEQLAREVRELRQGQALIRQQLDELKALLKARPSAAARTRPAVAEDLSEATFDISDDPARGDPSARLVMMEFSDYQCPYCARHASRVLPRIEQEYVATGRLRYVFRDFPLERIHPQAFDAARAANCAGEQGRYWEMHDRLFAQRKAIAPFAPHAEAVGVADMAAFGNCLDSGRYADEVRADMAEGRRAGVSSTPTFVVGFDDGRGSVTGVRIVRGALTFERLVAEIEAARARR